MPRLSDLTATTTLAGSETFPVVTNPGGGSTGTKKITASNLATQLASLGAYATGADITSLDTRVDALEEGGGVKTDLVAATYLSNTTSFQTAASYAAIAGELVAGDTLHVDYTGLIFNNSASNQTFNFKFTVGSFTLVSMSPAATGASLASSAFPRVHHWWAEIAFITATSALVTAGMNLSAVKTATTTDAASFNGTTTYLESNTGITDASINTANAMTFALQVSAGTAAATITGTRHQQRWSVLKSA